MKSYAKPAILLIIVGIIAAFLYHASEAQAEQIVCIRMHKPSYPAKSVHLAGIFTQTPLGRPQAGKKKAPIQSMGAVKTRSVSKSRFFGMGFAQNFIDLEALQTILP